MARSLATSSSHWGLLTPPTAHTTRKWAGITAIQSTSYRRCPLRVLPTSTIKYENRRRPYDNKTTPTLNNYLNPTPSPAPTICIPVDQILLPSHAFLRHADCSRSSVWVCVCVCYHSKQLTQLRPFVRERLSWCEGLPLFDIPHGEKFLKLGKTFWSDSANWKKKLLFGAILEHKHQNFFWCTCKKTIVTQKRKENSTCPNLLRQHVKFDFECYIYSQIAF